MSIVEDIRKVLQDFLAPEMREIKIRVEALEKRVDAGFDDMIKHMDQRFTSLETNLL